MDWPCEGSFPNLREQLTVLLIRCGQKLGGSDGTAQTQGRILKMLYLQGPMTQKELQEKLAIRPGSMSEITAKLERKGLLHKARDTSDRRKVFLSLTEAGRADVEQFCAQGKTPRSRSFTALTADEQQTLFSLLEKLYASWD